jgi:hypothetical protein
VQHEPVSPARRKAFLTKVAVAKIASGHCFQQPEVLDLE